MENPNKTISDLQHLIDLIESKSDDNKSEIKIEINSNGHYISVYVNYAEDEIWGYISIKGMLSFHEKTKISQSPDDDYMIVEDFYVPESKKLKYINYLSTGKPLFTTGIITIDDLVPCLKIKTAEHSKIAELFVTTFEQEWLDWEEFKNHCLEIRSAITAELKHAKNESYSARPEFDTISMGL